MASSLRIQDDPGGAELWRIIIDCCNRASRREAIARAGLHRNVAARRNAAVAAHCCQRRRRQTAIDQFDNAQTDRRATAILLAASQAAAAAEGRYLARHGYY